jgi:phage terminase large subunit-like protein
MKCIPILSGLLLVCWTWSCNPPSKEWSGDALEILTRRQASNDALKAHDMERELLLMTDSVQITVSNGTLIKGKALLKEYITSVPDAGMYWVRTPDEIEVNAVQGLAWESGTWKGYRSEETPEPVVGGKYAAQWTKKNGTWKINSELFVLLK